MYFHFWFNLCPLARAQTDYEIIDSTPFLWTIVCNNKPSKCQTLSLSLSLSLSLHNLSGFLSLSRSLCSPPPHSHTHTHTPSPHSHLPTPPSLALNVNYAYLTVSFVSLYFWGESSFVVAHFPFVYWSSFFPWLHPPFLS